MVLKFLSYLLMSIVVFIIAMLIAPILPLFSRMIVGPCNNGSEFKEEPRLHPKLDWFQTPDNSLWGDSGWRTLHCKNWKSYWGMVKWLWRNPRYGFSWGVLGYPIYELTSFEIKHSGNFLDVNKNGLKQGWFYIKSNDGAFQFRLVKCLLGYCIAIDMGWGLDVYALNENAFRYKPRAIFHLSPKIFKIK